MAQNDATYTILKSHPVKRVGNTNYFLSIQKITNTTTGTSSDHLVIKKQGVNEDGSLRGQTRQLFISVDHSVELLEEIGKFLSK